MRTQLRADLNEEKCANLKIVGIHSGGAWLAQRLHQDLALTSPIGMLDISFYRDDFQKIGLHPQVRPSQIPFDVDEARLLLVDDVLYTGRTIRAALNTLFDYGRPARIDLAVLVDRGGRELPIEPRWLGASITLPVQQDLVLTRTPQGQLSFVIEQYS